MDVAEKGNIITSVCKTIKLQWKLKPFFFFYLKISNYNTLIFILVMINETVFQLQNSFIRFINTARRLSQKYTETRCPTVIYNAYFSLKYIICFHYLCII